MQYAKEEKILIWLDSFIGLEYRHKQEIYKKIISLSDVGNAVAACKEYIIANTSSAVYNTIENSYNSVYIDYLLSGLERRNITAVTVASKNYPERLLKTALPPPVLYAKGNVGLMNSKTFGMVGSRKSLPVSVNIAKRFAEELSDSGFTLVTGIAEGVDSAVINGALNSSGNVISVIAGGMDCIYPASNAELIEKVAEKGLVLAEYPPKRRPERFMFPVRNRIIAGLSDGVLIVSGGKKSGTLYTAEYAEEYGRDLFAVPYGIGVQSGEGCNDLIKRGAMLCDSSNDVTNFYGVKKKEKKIALTAEETNVINALRDGEKHIEEISKLLKREPYEVQTTLSVLEIKGVVAKNGVNVYGLIIVDSEE